MMFRRTLTSAAVILTLGVGTAAVAADDLQQAGQSAENAIEQTGEAIESGARSLTNTEERARTQARSGSQAGQSGQTGEQTAASGTDQERTQIKVDQAPAEAQVTQPAPDVTVIDPEPRVKVDTKKPQVSINQPKPEVEVDQATPQVEVNKAGQPDVTIKETSPAQPMQTGQNQDQSQRDPAQKMDETAQDRSQDQMNQGQTQDRAAQSQMSQDQQAQPQGQAIAGRELIGKEVIGQTGEQVGEVTDVIVNDSGMQKVIIERGGFLGMGEKEVAVDMEKLSISPDGITLNMTDQQLSQMPDYEDQGIVNPDTMEARPVAPEGAQPNQ